MVVIYVADQTLTFIYSCILGAALGIVYDVFRISRVAFSTSSAAVFIEDVIFFALCAVSTFFMLMGTVHGQIRGFLVLGVIIGGVLYYFTIGRLVMKVSRLIIDAINRAIEFIFAYIISPVWRFFYFIISIIARPFMFLGKILKKSLGKAKYNLKVGRVVLYNHIVDYFFRRTGKKSKEHSSVTPDNNKPSKTGIIFKIKNRLKKSKKKK